MGKGGEGIVFEVEGKFDLVVKIYLMVISSERVDKLLVMVVFWIKVLD